MRNKVYNFVHVGSVGTTTYYTKSFESFVGPGILWVNSRICRLDIYIVDHWSQANIWTWRD